MKSFALSSPQFHALAAIREIAARHAWTGGVEVVEGTLFYHVPLREHPDVCGVIFAMDDEGENLQLYLLLPARMDACRIGDAYEFAARHGHGRRFGALEMSAEHGTLRIRMDADIAADSVGETVSRLVDRGMALAHDVSAAWRALCWPPNHPRAQRDISEIANS